MIYFIWYKQWWEIAPFQKFLRNHNSIFKNISDFLKKKLQSRSSFFPSWLWITFRVQVVFERDASRFRISDVTQFLNKVLTKCQTQKVDRNFRKSRNLKKNSEFSEISDFFKEFRKLQKARKCWKFWKSCSLNNWPHNVVFVPDSS
jgi:hypothetical protein